LIKSIKLITASSFLAMLFMGVSSALIGAASRDIGLTATQIGLLIAAQNVGFVFSVTISGAMADSRPLPRIAILGSIILGVSFRTRRPSSASTLTSCARRRWISCCPS
jgi:MFS family permease